MARIWPDTVPGDLDELTDVFDDASTHFRRERP
jgi:hypothetical protein